VLSLFRPTFKFEIYPLYVGSMYNLMPRANVKLNYVVDWVVIPRN